ncbi:MAG: hypothetical protein II153_01085, partial [Erysipelotrichaceae bacterium]|nr:hypothetical protein [Erysipelotrichaceae bacterium]
NSFCFSSYRLKQILNTDYRQEKMSDGTFSDFFLFFLSPVQLQQHITMYDTPDDHKRQHRTIRHIHLYVTHKCRPVERQQMPDQLFIEDEVLQSPGIESHKKEKQAKPYFSISYAYFS